MNWRGLTALALAVASGALMKVGDLYQPFRLRNLQVINATPATEAHLLAWSAPFAQFEPLWRFHWHELDQWRQNLPLKLTVQSNFWAGCLQIVVESLPPVVELVWQGQRLFLTMDGHLWAKSLADRYMLSEPPDLPTLRLDASFPIAVLSTDGTLDGMARSDLPAGWVLGLLKTLEGQSPLVASDVMLRRRGGEDVVQCRFSDGAGHEIRFMGSADRLSLTLPVVRQLLTSGQTKNYGLLDATYQDKIILRQVDSIVADR